MRESLLQRRPANLVKKFLGSHYVLLVNYSTKYRRQWMDKVTRLHCDSPSSHHTLNCRLRLSNRGTEPFFPSARAGLLQLA